MSQNIHKFNYPFGSVMQTRNWSASSYRYGFNGKEKDDEINVDGGSYDFGARIYDGRLGKWLSVDPLQAKYPNLSPYNFCSNNSILFLDLDGRIFDLSKLSKEERIQYNATIKVLQSSEIFSYYYQRLENSKTVYSINAGEDVKVNGETVGGYYKATEHEVGVKTINSFVLAQELFHAYQDDGQYYQRPLDYSTLETEGDIATVYVMLEANLGFPANGDWMQEIEEKAFEEIPTSKEVSSDNYNKMFQKAVDDRIEYYKKQDLNTPTYTSPNSGEKPKALAKALKEAESPAIGPKLENGDYYSK